MPEQQPQQQVPWGTMDPGMAKSEAAKLEGRTMRVPSPGEIVIRICPPWRPDLRQAFHTWVLHYGFRVEGFNPTHVCRKMYGESYCPGCKAASRLYDRSAHDKDPLHSAASDVRSATRFLYSAVAGVGQQTIQGQNGPVVLTDVVSGEPVIQAYSANEQVHKALLRHQADFGNYVDPYNGHDVQLVRQASGKQEAKFAPTQVYMIQQASCVSQRILDLMMAGLPVLDKFYEPTPTEEFDRIAELYYQKSLEKVGMASGTQVVVPQMGGAPGVPGVQGGMPTAPGTIGQVPMIPAGMPAAPAPQATYQPAPSPQVPVGAAPPPMSQGQVPAGAGIPAAQPQQVIGDNPFKALIPPTDYRLQQGIPIPNCFGRYKSDDPDCQTCAYKPESEHITKQLATGIQPSLADFVPPAGAAAGQAQVPAQQAQVPAQQAQVPAQQAQVPAQQPQVPAQAQVPAQQAQVPAGAPAPAQPPPAPQAGMVPADQLDSLEASLMQGNQQPPPQG